MTSIGGPAPQNRIWGELDIGKSEITGNKGVRVYTGVKAILAKIFGVVVEVKEGDKTVIVNRDSFERFIARNTGDKKFHVAGHSPGELANIMMKGIGAKRGAAHIEITNVTGTITGTAKELKDFINTLSAEGISLDDRLKKMFESTAPDKKMTIPKEQVAQLRQSAKEILAKTKEASSRTDTLSKEDAEELEHDVIEASTGTSTQAVAQRQPSAEMKRNFAELITNFHSLASGTNVNETKEAIKTNIAAINKEAGEDRILLPKTIKADETFRSRIEAFAEKFGMNISNLRSAKK